MYLFRCLSNSLSKLCTSAGFLCTCPLSGSRIETESSTPTTAIANNAFELNLFLPCPNPSERIEARSITNFDQKGCKDDLKLARNFSMKTENIKRTNQTVKGQTCIKEYSLLRRTASI